MQEGYAARQVVGMDLHRRRSVLVRMTEDGRTNLVRCLPTVDVVEGVAEVVRHGVGGGDEVGSGLGLDGAVTAGGLDELADRPAGLVLDPGLTAKAALRT